MHQIYLFGYPITTSWSPVMHKAAFKACEMAGEYIVMSLPPEALQGAVEALRHGNVLGANVTMPYKQTVMPMLNEIAPEARTLGAVNTIVNRDGWLVGHNTDVAGAVATLHTLMPKDKQILLLGAGGAARAVLGALCQDDLLPSGVILVNRSTDRLNQIEPYLATLPYPIVPVTPETDELDALTAPCKLMINTTTAGVLWTRLAFSAPIWDLNYGRKSELLRHYAAERKLAFTDGSFMLAAQAQKAFALWTGYDLRLDIFHKELTNVL
jgi:shikimate dehydrogenase